MFSINVIDIALGEDEFVVSHDSDAYLKVSMWDTKLFEDTGKRADYGFVKAQPIWRVKQGIGDINE